MGHHRVKEEKLQRIRLGSRYFGFNLAQFYWECLQLASVSEGLTETDILRRIIRSWSETLPTAIQEKARAETTHVEAWKAQEKRAQRDAKLQAKQAKLNTRRATSQGKESPKAPNAGGTTPALAPEPMMGLPVAKSGLCEVNSPKPH
jgi:reverse gyrase